MCTNDTQTHDISSFLENVRQEALIDSTDGNFFRICASVELQNLMYLSICDSKRDLFSEKDCKLEKMNVWDLCVWGVEGKDRRDAEIVG